MLCEFTGVLFLALASDDHIYLEDAALRDLYSFSCLNHILCLPANTTIFEKVTTLSVFSCSASLFEVRSLPSSFLLSIVLCVVYSWISAMINGITIESQCSFFGLSGHLEGQKYSGDGKLTNMILLCTYGEKIDVLLYLTI